MIVHAHNAQILEDLAFVMFVDPDAFHSDPWDGATV